MGARRRGSPSAVERCSYPKIMSGLHLLYPQTSTFFGYWYRSLTVVYIWTFIPESAIVHRIDKVISDIMN